MMKCQYLYGQAVLKRLNIDLYVFAENLRSLINCAWEHHIVFIYALSPGLDMVFSSSKEVDILKKKIKQVWCMVWYIALVDLEF